MPDYHLFLSYARADNKPVQEGGVGWVTAFHDRLTRRHRRYAGRDLKPFFDTTEIITGHIW